MKTIAFLIFLFVLVPADLSAQELAPPQRTVAFRLYGKGARPITERDSADWSISADCRDLSLGFGKQQKGNCPLSLGEEDIWLALQAFTWEYQNRHDTIPPVHLQIAHDGDTMRLTTGIHHIDSLRFRPGSFEIPPAFSSLFGFYRGPAGGIAPRLEDFRVGAPPVPRFDSTSLHSFPPRTEHEQGNTSYVMGIAFTPETRVLQVKMRADVNDSRYRHWSGRQKPGSTVGKQDRGMIDLVFQTADWGRTWDTLMPTVWNAEDEMLIRQPRLSWRYHFSHKDNREPLEPMFQWFGWQTVRLVRVDEEERIIAQHFADPAHGVQVTVAPVNQLRPDQQMVRIPGYSFAQTMDGGRTWNMVYTDALGDDAVAVAHSGRTLVAVTGRFMLMSPDLGGHWRFLPFPTCFGFLFIPNCREPEWQGLRAMMPNDRTVILYNRAGLHAVTLTDEMMAVGADTDADQEVR